jgi:hypothetical protein
MSGKKSDQGDRRRGHAAIHSADPCARSALLLVDRHRLRAADRDALGGRHACFFRHLGRRRGQCQPAGRDADLGVGRDHRHARRAGGRCRAVLPAELGWYSHYPEFVADRQAQVITSLTIVATVFLPLS